MAKAPPIQNVDNLIGKAAVTAGIPPELYAALIKNGERSWKGWQTSRAGAMGPAQLMPGTAANLAKQYGINPNDYYGNLLGGAYYLKEMLTRFKNPRLAVAAYNAGPVAVQKYGDVPPYAETQKYVGNVFGGSGAPQGGSAAAPPTIPTGEPASSLVAPQGGGAPDVLNAAAPSDTTVNILQKLGGTASEAAQASQAPIPMPQQAPTANGTQQNGQAVEPQIIPHSGGLLGNIPMTLGGKNPYTNIHFAGHVDFQHVNPRLLDAVNREAKKMGVVATVISGYRSNDYSSSHGGFKGDPHTKGVAADVYINGHPIGDVVAPEVWAKYGIRSGATPGFYKGKSDPEHLDLIGIPVKQGGKR